MLSSPHHYLYDPHPNHHLHPPQVSLQQCPTCRSTPDQAWQTAPPLQLPHQDCQPWRREKLRYLSSLEGFQFHFIFNSRWSDEVVAPWESVSSLPPTLENLPGAACPEPRRMASSPAPSGLHALFSLFFVLFWPYLWFLAT